MGDKNNKPLDVVKDGGNGRPEVSDLQYEMWVTAMSPWLRQGSSIRRALTMAGLTQHKDSVYKKYQESGWFADRIDELRSQFGEMVNETIHKIIEGITEKVKQDRPVTDTDLKALGLGMKHRTAQPFFVTRVENAEADESKLGKVIDTLESTDYDDVAKQAKEQVVETQPPVQSEKQTGATGDVPTEPNAVATPS